MAIRNPEKSSRDIVYAFLRKKIVDMEIMPGAVINLNDLSDFLHVSRSPIRDALMQLELESLVETAPQKGTYVSKIDTQKVKDERFLRACIEEKIAASFLSVYDAENYRRMEELLEAQKHVFECRDTREFLALDDAFHSLMYEVTGQYYCLKIINNFSGHYHRIRLLTLSDHDICREAIEQHEEIMVLVKDKNLEELQQKLTIHITEKGPEVLKMQRRFPHLFTITEITKPSEKNIWEGDFLAEI